MSNRTRHVRRLWIGSVVAVGLIAATAIAGLAAPNGVKYFKFTATPVDSSGNTMASVAAGATNQVFLVKVTNSSPSGSSSNISSLTVTVPSQFTITAADIYCRGASSTSPSPCPTFDSNPNASTPVPTFSQPSGQAGTVTVTSLDPIKRMQYVTVKITTNITSSGLSCGNNNSGNWAVQAYTGSQLNGDSFVENPVNGTPYTTITMTCTLSFTVQPSAVAKNTAIAPAVQVTVSNGASGVTVTMSKNSGPGALSGTLTATTNGSGVASFSNLQLDTAGTYTLNAAATNYGNATSNSFTVYEATLACDGNDTTFSGTDTTVNLSGTGCTGASYPTTVTDSTVDIAKPNVAGNFDITIVWGLAVPTSDPQDVHTTVTVNGQTFTPTACDTSVNDGYPVNPDGDGNFWPAGTADQPWCLASYSWDGTHLTQVFKGSGDPSFSRN